MTLAAGSKLGPYEILSPIGAGGMGEVYRARDLRLDRDVAVKVLPAEVASDSEALARFEREAKAVAALSHQNILSIFDFGAHEGIGYAVTELLEGETLRARLDAGPIPQKQAVDFALQIARGLSAAHERGIVHRDLKPENLFLTKDGGVKILDFGLAKRVMTVAPGQETSAPTISSRTEPGTMMGTVGYMSPEQVKGLPVDSRSDIFSFGAVLYEMLSGQRAFSRPTASEAIVAILKEEPPDLSQTGHDVSPALDHIVRHCLEKDRNNRFQSARDIAFALSEASAPTIPSGVRPPKSLPGTRKVLIAAAVIVTLAAAGVFVLRRLPSNGKAAEGVKRVAVLPFENLGSPEDDYFVDGIADAVRGKLTSLPGLEVIARGSSVPYKKTPKTPRQIAGELDAPYLLMATVRWQKSGGASRVQVSPELVQVKASGAPASKWQQPFDTALTDVFQVQSDIATRVAGALGVALGATEEKRLSEKPTQSLAAYDAFLKGKEAENSGARRALGFYEQAVALDPGFTLAWARVASTSAVLFWSGTPVPDLAERSRQAAEKAVALAPDNPEGYLALGDYQQYVAVDLGRAIEQYNRALRLGPINADLLAARANVEKRLGHWDAAIDHLKQAERLDPRSAGRDLGLGVALLCVKRSREAREVLDRGLALAPSVIGLIQIKAETFLVEGDLARARAVVMAAPKEIEPTELVATLAAVDDLVWVLDDQQTELLLRLTPSAFDDNQAAWALCLAQAYALKSDSEKLRTYAEKAREAFQRQLAEQPRDAQRHALLGLALAYLGRKEEAVREGERAVALQPVEKNAFFGPYYQHQLVRIYILVGEPDKALDQLEPLLKTPYILSPGWLKIDPNFDPLRSNPRFQKLVAGAS
jgi:eukaryotic-like serine/threonine-protein kinase